MNGTCNNYIIKTIVPVHWYWSGGCWSRVGYRRALLSVVGAGTVVGSFCAGSSVYSGVVSTAAVISGGASAGWVELSGKGGSSVLLWFSTSIVQVARGSIQSFNWSACLFQRWPSSVLLLDLTLPQWLRVSSLKVSSQNPVSSSPVSRSSAMIMGRLLHCLFVHYELLLIRL